MCTASKPEGEHVNVRFGLTPEQETFRDEARRFLSAEHARGSFTPLYDGWLIGWSPELSHKLAARGWIGMTWPAQYGGQGRTYLDRLVLTEEMMRAGAPVAYHWHADRQVGPAILAHGSEDQKQWFLPRISQAEVSFCIGMSEPGAGSDLASLTTRAQWDGSGYIVNGQKTYITNAHRASFMYLVARTDPSVPKHRGLSEFIVELGLPGITVRPLLDMAGGHDFNEVYLDNVRLPGSTLLGQRNQGWNQIVKQLDYERAGIERLMGNYLLFGDVMAYVLKTHGKREQPVADAVVRAKLSELAVEMEVGRLLIYRVAWILTEGKVPTYEAAMAKTYGAEFQQRLANTATRILGLHGQLLPSSKHRLFHGLPATCYLRSVMQTIGGGTSEILRNIVALRGLGLPSK
ncbi:MAG: acyl-CoA dehydrogenase family protein [Chloroflexota bacterium]